MKTNYSNSSGTDDESIDREARRRGKASFHNWLSAQTLGKDPDQYKLEAAKKYREKRLAYSEYVRYDGGVSNADTKPLDEGDKPVPQPAVTIENIKGIVKELLVEERKHTRAMIKAEVNESVGELRGEFQSFIEDNFNPTMKKFDQHFDRVEDHLDRLDIDVAALRTDVRHIKQVLNMPGDSTNYATSTP